MPFLVTPSTDVLWTVTSSPSPLSANPVEDGEDNDDDDDNDDDEDVKTRVKTG
jgi:hypothetical protein